MQNPNTRCIGWTNPSASMTPQITTFSSFFSPAGSSTLVSIYGNNFYSFSIVKFGTYYPSSFFINSNIIQFYVPKLLISGSYPVYVINGSIYSNVATYTIDNASGFWLLNSYGYITNSNANQGINPGFISRNAPKVLQDGIYTVQATDNWLTCINPVQTVLTLPIPTGVIGREIMIKTQQGAVLSSINNINSFDGTITSTTILDGVTVPQWCTLVSNGTNWDIMQQG
jgi:hypothetical protein